MNTRTKQRPAPTKPDSWTDHQVKAITAYGETHNLRLTNESNQNPLVYYRTAAGLRRIKHIDDVMDAYEAVGAVA